MSRRSSSTNVVDSGISREIGTRYQNVKIVADNIDAVIAASQVDLEQLAKDLQEATDFTGISVVSGTEAGWNPVTKVITVPTVKGDKGDVGDDLKIINITSLGGGVFTWDFSDGSSYTTPSLTGPRGLKGDIGDKGESVYFTSITSTSNGRFIWTFSDGSSYTTPSLTGGKGDKGDKGDKGEDLKLSQITTTGNGVFVWRFSDGTTYTTPSLLGPRGLTGEPGLPGVKGDQGVSVHHMKLSNTTEPNGNFGVFGELDTYTFYGDAAETNVLGWFSVRNGISGDTDLDALGLMRRQTYDVNNSGVVDNSERLAGLSLADIKLDLINTINETYRAVSINELDAGVDANERFVTAVVMKAWLDGKNYLSEIPNKAVTNTKLADMGANTLKGRHNTAGIPQDLTPTAVLDIIGVEAGATQNSSDEFLLDRSNHEGVQPMSTISGLAGVLDDKVDKVDGKGLSDNNFTDAEKTKLSTLESSKFKGEFVSLAALTSAYPTADIGAYANVDAGGGVDVKRYIWDSSDNSWVEQIGVSTQLTGAQIKALYEDQPDTNAFTDTEKTKLNSYPASMPTGSTSIVVDSQIKRAAIIGDVTIPENSNTATIPNGTVTNDKLANAPADTLKGRINTSGTPADLTPAEVRELLDVELSATYGADWEENLANIPQNIELWKNIAPSSKFNTPTGTTEQYVRGDGSLATFTGGGETGSYSAGNGLTLSGTEFSLPVDIVGTGSYVQSVVQTTNGISVTLGTPPGASYDTSSVSELVEGLSSVPKLQTAENLNSWVNSKGFLTAFSESDPTVPSYVKAITATNISNWDEAFLWGNHADEGYAITNPVGQGFLDAVNKEAQRTYLELGSAAGRSVTAGPFDATDGALAAMRSAEGIFGLGATAPTSASTQLDGLAEYRTGFYRANLQDGSTNFPISDNGAVLNMRMSPSRSVKVFVGDSTDYLGFKRTGGGWREVWHGGNLAKQSSASDRTAGRVALAENVMLLNAENEIIVGSASTSSFLTKYRVFDGAEPLGTVLELKLVRAGALTAEGMPSFGNANNRILQNRFDGSAGEHSINTVMWSTTDSANLLAVQRPEPTNGCPGGVVTGNPSGGFMGFNSLNAQVLYENGSQAWTDATAFTRNAIDSRTNATVNVDALTPGIPHLVGPTNAGTRPGGHVQGQGSTQWYVTTRTMHSNVQMQIAHSINSSGFPNNCPVWYRFKTIAGNFPVTWYPLVTAEGGSGGVVEPQSSAVVYDAAGRITTATDIINGSERVKTLTYNSDGTLNTVTTTYLGTTRVETLQYTNGRYTGYTAT